MADGPWNNYQSQGAPWQRYGTQVKNPPPSYPYEGPQAAANLQHTQQEVQQTAATMKANETKAENEAKKSGIDLAAAQTDLNIKQGTPPGDASKYGAAYLATLPPGVADLTQAMLGGKYKGSITNSRNPVVMQAALAAQHATHGQFDAGKYDERLALIKSVTDPNSSLGALNTALAHAGVLYDQAPSVAGTDALGHNPLSVGANAAWNMWHSSSPAVATYEDIVGKYGPEQAKAYQIGTGGERGDIERQYSVNLPLDTKQALLRKDAQLFSGKIASLAHGYDMLGANSPLDYLSPDAKAALQKIDPDTYNKILGNPAMGGALPPSSNQPPSSPPTLGGPPSAPQGSPPGSPPPTGPQSLVPSGFNFFQQTYKNVPVPGASALGSQLIAQRVPYEAAMAQLQQRYPGATMDRAAYNAALQNPHGGSASATRQVPTTLGERAAASPEAAAISGFGSGATAGLADVALRHVVPNYDQGQQALASTNPGSNLFGNLAGGVAGTLAGGRLLGAVSPKAAQTLADLYEAHPVLTSAGIGGAQGAVYGASENPNNPLGGAAGGLALGALTGGATTAGVRSLGSMVAPTGGNLGPLFQANPAFRPTIGQRLSASNSPFVRALGAGEQAAESIPITGGIQSAARGAATDQMQRGAFNSALGEIGQQLPAGILKGPKAHAFMQDALGQAQNDARTQMQFAADPQYAQDLGAWQRSPSGLALSSDQIDNVQNTIAKALNGRVDGNAMSGPNYAAAASDLSRVARQWGSNPATSGQAAYLRDFLGIMDDAAKRASPPEVGQALDAANRGYAKGVIIENAARSAGGPPTEFTGRQLLRAVQNSDDSVRDRSFLQGQGLMQDYATAADRLSPSLADSGTPQRLAWMNLAGGAEAGGLLGAAAYGGHPSVLAPWAIDSVANLPGVRNTVGALMAPREATLPSFLSQPLNVAGGNLKKLAPYVGNAAVPGTLAWYASQ